MKRCPDILVLKVNMELHIWEDLQQYVSIQLKQF